MFDPTPFINAIQSHAKDVRDRAARAVETFGERVMARSQELVPVSPTNPAHELYIGTSGALAHSGTVKDAVWSGSTVVVLLGYGVRYAAAVHEDVDADHEYEGRVNELAQAKFLEQPMRELAKAFVPHVQRALGGA